MSKSLSSIQTLQFFCFQPRQQPFPHPFLVGVAVGDENVEQKSVRVHRQNHVDEAWKTVFAIMPESGWVSYFSFGCVAGRPLPWPLSPSPQAKGVTRPPGGGVGPLFKGVSTPASRRSGGLAKNLGYTRLLSGNTPQKYNPSLVSRSPTPVFRFPGLPIPVYHTP